MGCKPCLLLDIHVLDHQFKPQLGTLKFFQQKIPGIFQLLDIHALDHQFKPQLGTLKFFQQKIPGIFQTIQFNLRQNVSIFNEL